ncbi:MAG TPA: glycogen/starch synthase [Vicinamibacterales bacterium]|nr:glycogen/starch synthase [Vicinamibacterales bacterium]
MLYDANRAKEHVARAQFVMTRYETEFTPCTGITAVSKQERRHFRGGITVAPWCPRLDAARDAVSKGKVVESSWKFPVADRECTVMVSDDGHTPCLLLAVDGRFLGRNTPYDPPPNSVDRTTIGALRADALYFGIAVEEMLKQAGSPYQFVWGADWETVPALVRVRHRYLIALTLHNTYDEALETEARRFNDQYDVFLDSRPNTTGARTALEVGLEVADVVTTVNRGFARGMRTEPIQSRIIARHLQYLLDRVVGIDNAAFEPLSAKDRELHALLLNNFTAGAEQLFESKKTALKGLPSDISSLACDKAVVVTMGRRVAQKQHDLLVESVRQLLTEDPAFPLLVIFATTPGDQADEERVNRIIGLSNDFPRNVVWSRDRITYYSALMQAADFNCMPSLYEPHGGAYAGTVIPIARAVDGLAEQICAYAPDSAARKLNELWHGDHAEPTGFLFREDGRGASNDEWRQLLEEPPATSSSLFRAMRDSLTVTLKNAVTVRRERPIEYARLVLAALGKQLRADWLLNLGGMLALVERARSTRDPRNNVVGWTAQPPVLQQLVTPRIPYCPMCGSPGQCKGRDVGGVEYYDYFVFWCEHCGHVRAAGLSGGSPIADSYVNSCPYCGASELSHGEPLPAEISNLVSGFGEGILRTGAASSG